MGCILLLLPSQDQLEYRYATDNGNLLYDISFPFGLCGRLLIGVGSANYWIDCYRYYRIHKEPLTQ
jgi:hypothetical protein